MVAAMTHGLPTTVDHADAARLSELTASDGVVLRYRRFAPPEPPRGAVIYLHGIRSHGGWYVETASDLAHRGYAVYLPDRRGAGASDGPRGALAGRTQLVNDAGYFVSLAHEDTAGRPVFLIAGCWGVRPGLEFARRHPGRLAGLVLVAPALKANVDLTAREKATVACAYVLGSDRRTRVPLTPELFTDDPGYRAFIRDDPLSVLEATPRFFVETARWARALRRLHRLELPVLLLQSLRDPIVDAPAVLDWFERLVAPDKKAIVYSDFGHILDFEPERRRYWDDLAAWLEAHSVQPDRGAS
jgi:alpha-beta hydrolase superfamily lysophospholipase